MRLTSIRNGFVIGVFVLFIALHYTYSILIAVDHIYSILIAIQNAYSILIAVQYTNSEPIPFQCTYRVLTVVWYAYRILTGGFEKNMVKKHKWHRCEKTQKLQSKDSIVHFILHKNRSLKSHLFLDTFRSVFTYHFHSCVLIQNKMGTNKTVLVFLC